MLEMLTLLKDGHSENAYFPIDVTLSGIVTDVRDSKP